jgi:transcriptional regulator with XRE-family HTH domain
MELKKKIAVTIGLLRRKQEIKITQQEIANEIGISVRYYHDLETGKKMPTLSVINEIASVYQMKLSELCRLIEEADK